MRGTVRWRRGPPLAIAGEILKEYIIFDRILCASLGGGSLVLSTAIFSRRHWQSVGVSRASVRPKAHNQGLWSMSLRRLQLAKRRWAREKRNESGHRKRRKAQLGQDQDQDHITTTQV